MFFFNFYMLNAQTYIRPIIGYDFANMNTNDDELAYVHINDYKFGVDNLALGIGIKQRIKKRYEVTIYSVFSKRYAKGWLFNIVPFDGLKFNYIQNGLQFNYKFHNYFCGIGANYNLLTSFTLTVDKKKEGKSFLEEINEKGVRLSFGRSYKNFNLEAYFYKGLTSNIDNNKILLQPIESLGILLTYDFKVFDGFRKKSKADCPKF